MFSRGCPRAFPCNRNRQTPDPVTVYLRWELSVTVVCDQDKTFPKSLGQLKPQDISFDFGQALLESGFPKREDSKGGVKGSVSREQRVALSLV